MQVSQRYRGKQHRESTNRTRSECSIEKNVSVDHMLAREQQLYLITLDAVPNTLLDLPDYG